MDKTTVCMDKTIRFTNQNNLLWRLLPFLSSGAVGFLHIQLWRSFGTMAHKVAIYRFRESLFLYPLTDFGQCLYSRP